MAQIRIYPVASEAIALSIVGLLGDADLAGTALEWSTDTWYVTLPNDRDPGLSQIEDIIHDSQPGSDGVVVDDALC